MLSIKNLTVKVDDKIILNDFNLSIKDGEVHVIMGPNGVGKSTLTKAIMKDKNYKIISGDIIYDGNRINDMKTDEVARLGVFLAMQNPIEIDGVTNLDFLRTALSSNDKSINLYSFMKETETEVKSLQMTSDMLNRSLNKGFSGGEKKKNEILQMKILKPNFIILDEIDSGVDVDSLKVISKNINDYKQENKKSSYLIITHYTHLLKYIKPDYVHTLKDGKIFLTGDYSLAKKIEENGFNFDDIMSNANDGCDKVE